MKKLSKILSVGLSLVMCASMVAPALALDIDQAYIDGLTVKNGNQYNGRPTSYVELKATDDDNVFNFVGFSEPFAECPGYVAVGEISRHRVDEE